MLTGGLVTRRGALAGIGGGFATLSMPWIARAQSAPLKLGHQYSIDHPVSVGVEKAVQLITERGSGRIKIDIFPSGQLGTGKELDQQVADASLDLTIDGPGIIGNWHRPVSIFEAPFLARDWDQLVRMMEGSWANAQFDILASGQNIRKVGRPWYYGSRQLTTRDREVFKVADAAGLKIRVPEVPVYLDMIKAIGASPTPMALSEVYLSLQTGVADGQENPVATINSQKFYEVQGVLNKTAHIVNPMLVAFSNATWMGLSRDDQKMIVEAFDEGGEVCNAEMNKLEGSLIEEFRSKGMKIVDTDRDDFRNAMAPVYSAHSPSWGEGVLERLQAI